MQYLLPVNMDLKDMQRTSEELCKVGNMQHVKTAVIIRKMNSEHKAWLDYEKDAFFDIYLLKKRQISLT